MSTTESSNGKPIKCNDCNDNATWKSSDDGYCDECMRRLVNKRGIHN